MDYHLWAISVAESVMPLAISVLFAMAPILKPAAMIDPLSKKFGNSLQ
jgi:hypothetical protein